MEPQPNDFSNPLQPSTMFFFHNIQLRLRPNANPPPLVNTSQDISVGPSSAAAAAEPQTGPVPVPSSPPDSQHEAENSESRPYEPSVLDIIVAKAMLYRAFSLPAEIVDRIIEFAEYWPHTSAVLEYDEDQPVARGTSSTENRFLLRTLPLGIFKQVHSDPQRYKTEPAKVLRLSAEQPVEQLQQWIGSPTAPVRHPCRKIVFTISSSDQGWGGEAGFQGTYKGSWTWFEAGLERIDASGDCGDHCPDHIEAGTSTMQPHISPCAMRTIIPTVQGEPHQPLHLHHPLSGSPEHQIQCNKTASHSLETYRIEWRADDNVDPESAQAEKLVEAGRGKATGSGEFVRNLKLGDVVTVWAKARFPGWSNNLRSLKVDVYWAI